MADPEAPDPLADELAEKLIEKREKLQYFIITASVAIIAFTFSNLNPGTGLLRDGSASLAIAGWALLLLAAGCSLLLIRARHEVYRVFVDMRYERRTVPTEEERTRVVRLQRRMGAGEMLMMVFFFAGAGVLAAAHGVALL